MKPFVIVPVASTVLQPPSDATRQLFERLLVNKLYDSRFSSDHEGMQGRFMELFNEGVSRVTHMWLAYRSGEPTEILGVAILVTQRERYLQVFVQPAYRRQGIGTALVEQAMVGQERLRVTYTETSGRLFRSFGLVDWREAVMNSEA